MARFVRSRRHLVTLFIVAVATPAAAQDKTPAPGDRVRITLTASAAERFGGGRWDSRLRAVDADSIALDATATSGALVVAKGDVAKFERYDGHKSKAGKGAAIGFAAGALTGGVAAFAASVSGGSCDEGFMSFDFFCEDSADTMGLAGAAAGGLLGLVIGAAVGAASSGDHWTLLDGQVQVAPTVIQGVPGVGMRLEF